MYALDVVRFVGASILRFSKVYEPILLTGVGLKGVKCRGFGFTHKLKPRGALAVDSKTSPSHTPPAPNQHQIRLN